MIDPELDPLWARALSPHDASARELVAARALDVARRTLFAKGAREAQREDLAQETVESVLRALRDAHPVRRFELFVKGRARGLLSDARRSLHSSMELSDPNQLDPAASDSQPAEDAVSRELVEALNACIDELSDALRDVARLRYQAGLEVGEISAQLGIDKGTVSVRTFRLVEKTRACLAGKGFGDEI